jgi:ketosteroid isomerase-like protein
MITEEFARKFAAEWIEAWNSHNLDRILSHYSEDFEIETPMAVKFLDGSNGIVSGKQTVQKYWANALEKVPNLHFKLIEILSGINGLTIYYENTATGRRTAENVFFNSEGKVNRCVANYSL